MPSLNLLIQSHLAIAVLSMAALIIILAAINILAFLKIRRLNEKSKLLFSGKTGENLEEIILGQSKEIKELDSEIQELFEISNKIHDLSFKGLHNVGLIRFNPFKDIGGDQSFAVALLDGKKSGIVISSLHTREGTRMYVKPVAQGNSEKYPLTEEEKQAVKIASPLKEKKV
jgi:hypothetical protein